MSTPTGLLPYCFAQSTHIYCSDKAKAKKPRMNRIVVPLGYFVFV